MAKRPPAPKLEDLEKEYHKLIQTDPEKLKKLKRKSIILCGGLNKLVYLQNKISQFNYWLLFPKNCNKIITI